MPPKLNAIIARSPFNLTLFASITAFFTYLCFYPFRRAYTAATYDELIFWGINFKILIITAQVLGFAVSKGLGIKYVSEMLPEHRSRNLLIMIALSWVCYLFFALTPAPFNLVFIFLASLPLGMVYGTILGFLEGRRNTDLLVAVLTASFIMGSGFAKSIGKWVMTTLQVSQFWMPFVACAIMIIPFGICTWLMGQIPPPTEADKQNRTERKPMQKADRKAFIAEFALSLGIFVISYVLLTTFREFRDNFTPEIWKLLGYGNNSAIFTQTETPIAITVLLMMAAMRWVHNNYKAFIIIQILMLAGGLLIGISTFLFEQHFLSPVAWLTTLGLGVYMAYAMCNSLYFERMIAAFKKSGTVGFLITFADYYAYLGSILVLFYKNFFQKSINYLDFFIILSYGISIIYVILVGLSMWNLSVKKRSES
ncbi:hypothetical protein Emtol_2755 [Emticicia oligotrophica DSM 17448]|uniref:MFS transporter n=2 Tax=Leadbetterellaceae TaxID=3141702 RepID=A0ABN4ANI8_EMTOG|nr:DUF5690 family protein [Emticicia oligotrophica]AFK03890.1 hypothetical protein Emtol_2755 [Emticicia oligotrophica DSM 17448]